MIGATSAFVGLSQVLAVVGDLRYGGAPDGWTVVSALGAVGSLLLVLLVVPRSIVHVGDGRLRWWVGRRHHDLGFDEIADIRRHPRSGGSQVVTTDGRVLRLPLQPQHGPEVWQLVLGDRSPSPA
ncbi:hypothetical protein GCM10028777_16240 [Angustibacter speluncae]